MKTQTIIVDNTSRGFLKHKSCAGSAKTAGLLLLLACLFLQGKAIAGERMSPGKDDQVSVGYLEVFSSTQETQWGEGSYYHPHTGYRIYDANGKTVKWVENHDNSTDETPEKVELAPGAYTVWAQSDKGGYVSVPVVVKLEQDTVVRLENDRERNKEAINSARAVTTSSSHTGGGKA